jgi:hypothetical protein
MDEAFQQPLAAIPDDFQHIENGIPVNPGNSLDTPNAATFDEKPDDLLNFLFALIGSVQLLRALAVGLVALATLESLIAFPVFPVPLAFAFAIVAGHRSCLSAKQAR